MYDHKWQVLLMRQATGSMLRVNLPENLNTSLNIATVENDKFDSTFDALTVWVAHEFCGWWATDIIPEHAQITEDQENE